MSRSKGDGLGKTGGRQKGSTNKIGRNAREVLAEIVDGNAEKAQKMLEMLVDPKEWLHYYIKLCEFRIPKQAAVNLEVDSKKKDINSELKEWAEKEIKK